MNRQQIVGTAVVLALLAGVWASSREPAAPPPEPQVASLPLAAAELSTVTLAPSASPSASPSPTFIVFTFEPEPTFTATAAEPAAVLVPSVTPLAAAPAAPPATQPPAPTANPPTAAPPPPPAAPDPSVAGAEQSLLDNVNYQRAQYGLAPLARDETLMQIARNRVNDMARRGYFSHHDPITGAELGRSQILGAGYSQGSENIFRSGGALAGLGGNAVAWFMSDGIHRAPILSTSYTSVGAGVAADGNFWVVAVCFGG